MLQDILFTYSSLICNLAQLLNSLFGGSTVITTNLFHYNRGGSAQWGGGGPLPLTVHHNYSAIINLYLPEVGSKCRWERGVLDILISEVGHNHIARVMKGSIFIPATLNLQIHPLKINKYFI